MARAPQGLRRTMVPAMSRVAACCVLLLLATASPAFTQDTVTTATGEKVVGEIKKVEKDIVTIETPYSDSDFKIKWEQVVAIDSARQFMPKAFPYSSGTGSGGVAPRARASHSIASPSALGKLVRLN